MEEIETTPLKPRIVISTLVEMPPKKIALPAPPRVSTVGSSRSNKPKPITPEVKVNPRTEPAEPTTRDPVTATQNNAHVKSLDSPGLTITKQAVRTGRALLRKLEAGDGPKIEITWPEKSQERDALYRGFVQCHGMVTAILADEGDLYREDEMPGRPWRPNHDIFSKYARESSGGLTPNEKILVDRIRRRHGLTGGVPVRLFTREADALLLAGLHRVAGGALERGENLRARYEISRGKIEIRDVRVGSKLVPGRFPLGINCS